MREERRRQLRAELIVRLERVRGQLTDTEFAQLVDSVERTAARFTEIDAGPVARRLQAMDVREPDT
jgi:hypothetical protein